MNYQLIKGNSLISSKNSLISLTSKALTPNNNFNSISLNNIPKKNLNTSNLIKNESILNRKISKLNFSISTINKDIAQKGPKVQPIQNIGHSILELTKINNNFNPNYHKAIPFYLNTVVLGVIPKNVFIQLKKYNKTFRRKNRPFSISSCRVKFSEFVNTFDKRCQVMNDLLTYWRDNNTFSCLKGWRNEVYPIFDGNHEIAFRIERSGIALFGFRAYGCHINGYVEDSKTHKLKMWIAQRSFNKQTFPGKLDNIVAGGISFPYNPTETAIKECLEEASMPNEISTQ
eukprot:jgi/Orpsp1_1/1189677/evm.model.d7180000073690.1